MLKGFSQPFPWSISNEPAAISSPAVPDDLGMMSLGSEVLYGKDVCAAGGRTSLPKLPSPPQTPSFTHSRTMIHAQRCNTLNYEHVDIQLTSEAALFQPS